jgi:signal peptidase II
MRTRTGTIALIVVLLALTIACDQATKGVARARLAGQGSVFLAGGVFVLHYVENEGAFLGLGSTLPPVARTAALVAFPILVVGIMIAYAARRGRQGTLLLSGFALIAGGGISNLIDRLARSGRVSDFMILRTRWISSGIFNVADLAILAGALLLLISALRERRPTS